MQLYFLVAMSVMKFPDMISTHANVYNPTCLLPWGVECMVDINFIIEGHSRGMYACEQISKTLKMDGICQYFYWM